MPIYEYSCITCDTSIEINRKFDDQEIIPPCNSCGYGMTRSYSSVGVQFKGSGFYKTDNPK
jgi:putative FmdB family regulatory protein